MLLCKKLRELQETALQLFVSYYLQSEAIIQQMEGGGGEKGKKKENQLSLRILKIRVFWDVMLCHRAIHISMEY
jgi:mRNA-degrading endonuclease RelE of RelBE toxin-antitoxin system